MNLLLLAFASLASADHILESEFESVTCGSYVKLTHQSTGFKLHSHEIAYGGGSGQQSVTGFPGANDPNSYFIVEGPLGTKCKRGSKITCNSKIRLIHANTKQALHSHLISSPISNEQEVSAFSSSDENDNWIIGCKTTHWLRESPVSFQHGLTLAYLSADSRYRFGHPIDGQLEICARKKIGWSNNEYWIAQEGIYFNE